MQADTRRDRIKNVMIVIKRTSFGRTEASYDTLLPLHNCMMNLVISYVSPSRGIFFFKYPPPYD